MAGGILPNSWAPLVSVADAGVRAIVLIRRAIVKCCVPGDPVFGRAVGAVVGQLRGTFHYWAMVGLVGGVRPTPTISDRRLEVRASECLWVKSREPFAGRPPGPR